MDTIVIRPLTLRRIDQTSAPIPSQLRYEPADPYAVTLHCHTNDEPVSWTFARHLLAEGLRTPCGDGDIHLAPTTDRTRLTIKLHSPAGHASLTAPANLVSWFLDAAYVLVPAGTEAAHLDLDLLLRHLHRS